ncbi:Protease PrsW [bioreactor metagenome]|uniref:Protease PrsW n=1 Tax=bioreactor metagenome TaxID=1076179 RepID=A0A645DX07_9ZZZZ|nr:PrsW family glutamic-type intramembrane protease [Erysipelotrichaceae bacterium]
MVNMLLAVLPTIVIITYILWFDRYNKEPRLLLVKLFFCGCLTVIPAAFLEGLTEQKAFYSYFDVFTYALFGIALIEEGFKFIATKIVAYKARAFDEIYDGIIYCVMVSLGFATVENIMYVNAYGTGTALLRAVTAVPAHTIFAVTMGYYLGLSKAMPQKRLGYQILALAVPILLHGIYDFILFLSFDWIMIVFGIYAFYLYKKAFRLINETYQIPPFR